MPCCRCCALRKLSLPGCTYSRLACRSWDLPGKPNFFGCDCKIEVFRSGCAKRIHPDDFSIFCQKRSSRVTWINWGLRLNDGRDVFAIVRSSRPFKGRAECADNSFSEGPRFCRSGVRWQQHRYQHQCYLQQRYLMDDEMELMLGVRALNHVEPSSFITSACTTSSFLALPLGSDGLNTTVT